MKRGLSLLYGVACYFFFLGVFLWAIWFVWKMDTFPAKSGRIEAIVIDAVLLGAFAIQHSGMARQGFKRVWTKFVPRPIERSTYVLASSLVLLGVVYFWQPMPRTIWQVQSAPWVTMLNVIFWVGWALLLTTTFLINHFDLFGVQQVWRFFSNRPYEPPKFVQPSLYKMVRHPLYLGFLIAFWSAPHMTLGHLFFAAMCTGYILVAIQWEERDLMTFHGEAYRVYRSGVSMLVPWPLKRKP